MRTLNWRWGLAVCLIAHGTCGVRATSAQTTLSGQTDLARLVDLSAQRLHVRISYDAGALKGQATLRQDAPLSDQELWQLTNRLLAEQGFTTIRAGDDQTMAVVKITTAAQAVRVERLEQLHADGIGVSDGAGPGEAGGSTHIGAGFRRVLVPLQRAATKDVLAAVQLVLSKPGGSVSEAEQAGLIVVADLTPYLDVALKLVDRLDGAEGGATFKQIPARNLDAMRLASVAKQLADKRKAVGGRELRGDLIAAPAGNAVLLIAPPAFVEQWQAIIESADQREPVERRTYTTGAFGTRDVANLIEQTVRGGGGAGSGGSVLGGAPGSGASGAGSTSGGGDDRWRIVFDDLTGTLIITATPAQHEQIAELLARLASVPAGSRHPVRTFQIRNRGVKEIQQVIEDLMRAGVLDTQTASDLPAPGQVGVNSPAAASQVSPRPVDVGGTPISGSPLPGAAGSVSGGSAPSPSVSVLVNNLGRGAHLREGPGSSAASSGTAAEPPALTLTSDEATNTLIAVGEPRLLSQLEQLLPTLDVRQPQVMLEAFLVSLNDSQTLDLGVELEKVKISGDTFLHLASLFGLSTATGSGSTTSRSIADSTGFTGVVLDPGNFSVLVKALATINKGRSLSSPKLLVSNNQQATFNSVLQQPFASTNASTTVSTTSFGGTQDAGTTISVKPQIAQGDHLALAADLYHGPAHNDLGVIYLKQGKLYEAAGEFEWARKLMPGHPDPRLNLALTLERAGKIDDAAKTYCSALDVYPGHIPTLEALTRLQLKHARSDEHTKANLQTIAMEGDSAKWREWAQVELARQE